VSPAWARALIIAASEKLVFEGIVGLLGFRGSLRQVAKDFSTGIIFLLTSPHPDGAARCR
jgi:hypothetical protein